MCPQEAGEGMAQLHLETQVNAGVSGAGSVAPEKALGAREAIPCSVWGCHLGRWQSEGPMASAVVLPTAPR